MNGSFHLRPAECRPLGSANTLWSQQGQAIRAVMCTAGQEISEPAGVEPVIMAVVSTQFLGSLPSGRRRSVAFGPARRVSPGRATAERGESRAQRGACVAR